MIILSKTSIERLFSQAIKKSKIGKKILKIGKNIDEVNKSFLVVKALLILRITQNSFWWFITDPEHIFFLNII